MRGDEAQDGRELHGFLRHGELHAGTVQQRRDPRGQPGRPLTRGGDELLAGEVGEVDLGSLRQPVIERDRGDQGFPS